MSAASRLDKLAQVHPEWLPWLSVVRVVSVELSASAWDASPPRLAETPDLAPLLAGAVLRPEGTAVARLLDSLTVAARAQGLHALVGEGRATTTPTAPAEALRVFLAAVNGDQAALDGHATRRGASSEGFRTLAQLLRMPYLHACARQWATSPRSPWSQGYCPVCGAWPAFAEVRGIDRARHLRCGGCGAGWPAPVLACTYCGSTDHNTLGALVVDDKLPRFTVDTCGGCSGYLKSLTTLQATPSEDIIAIDLESVEFDLAAVERGFLRPAEPGVALLASLDPMGESPPTPKRWWA